MHPRIVFDHDENGNRSKSISGDGTVTKYTYDERNLLTELHIIGKMNIKINGGIGWIPGKINININQIDELYTYEYDESGMQTAKNEPCGRTEYEYDELNRLTKITEPNGRITEYTYDAVGNRESQTITDELDEIIILYEYNELNQLTQTTETQDQNIILTEYTYDKNGNQTEIAKTEDQATETETYEYDVLNQLKKVTLANQDEISYTYYGNGLRATKTFENETTEYYYDRGRTIFEKNPQGEYSINIYAGELIGRCMPSEEALNFYAI